MEDKRIIELYFARNERAIAESDAKYGRYCHAIALGVLCDRLDAEECVNDTWADAWNAIPPHRPYVLSAFFGKITRRIAIDRWRCKTAARRGGGEMELALEELEECIAHPLSVEQAVEAKRLAEVMRAFVSALPSAEQKVFVLRYFHLEPLEAIARRLGFSQSKVKSMLMRTRKKLKGQLEEEMFL